jgi:hypothetical protein
MMVALLAAGIGLLLAGLAAIGFGIPVQEFSFGNTLILAGSVIACTGIMLLGLWIAVRELKSIAQRLGSGVPAVNLQPVAAASVAPDNRAPDTDGFPFGRGEPGLDNPGKAEPSASPPPWQDDAAARDRGRDETPPVPQPEPPPAVKPKRNLLFSSSSRKERERAQARAIDPSALDIPSAPAAPPPAPEPDEVSPPATFDEAWPQSDRGKGPSPTPPPMRSSRAPSTFTEPNAGPARADRYPPVPRNEDQPPVTVLKSGVVDGMAYSLYSDGSIEAQMPEGMMRFASIDELRSHLDHRP